MKEFWRFVLGLFVFILSVVIQGEVPSNKTCPNVKKRLDSMRKRRHLTFPDGSNTVITLSLTKAFLTHIPSGWQMTMELDVTFPMPDSEFVAEHSRRKLHHRQKRELWMRINNALELHNLNGLACIMRSVCEAKYHLAPPGVSLVHDILRAVFSVPSLEERFWREMGEKYQEVFSPDLCDRIHECPISLVHFILDLNRST